MISWGRLPWYLLWNVAIVCGVCVIRLQETCGLMDRNIPLIMPGDIGKETVGGHSRKSMSGHSAVSEADP